jgi:hypothetical protein
MKTVSTSGLVCGSLMAIGGGGGGGGGGVFTVYFGTLNMFITLWFGFDYGTNPPLGTKFIFLHAFGSVMFM